MAVRPSLVEVLGVDVCTLILQHATLEHPVSTTRALRSTCRLFHTASAAASRAALGMQAARLHDLRLRVHLQCDDNVPAVLVSRTCEAALRSGEPVADSPPIRRHQQVAPLRASHLEHDTQMHALLDKMQALHGARAVAIAVIDEEERRMKACPLPGFEWTCHRDDETLEASTIPFRPARDADGRWLRTRDAPERRAVRVWTVTVPGDVGTIWAGARCPLRMVYFEDYPVNSANLYFTKGFFHPNCYPSGRLCLPYWTHFQALADGNYFQGQRTEEKWTPALCAPVLLRLIQYSLDHPVNTDPSQMAAYLAYKDDRDGLYRRRVRKMIESGRYDPVLPDGGYRYPL